MTTDQLIRIVEGALLAAGKPLTVQQLGDLFPEDERPENEQIREALEQLSAHCEGRGFELRQVASGYRFQVVEDVAPWVGRMWEEKPQRYSRALLETLALIAYRQPITRGDIEDIRGVAVSSQIIKTLLEREWVRVVGHKDVPGRPAMYATTRKFLDYFNLRNLDDLPPLADIKDLDSLNGELGFGDAVEALAEVSSAEAGEQAGDEPQANLLGEEGDDSVETIAGEPSESEVNPDSQSNWNDEPSENQSLTETREELVEEEGDAEESDGEAVDAEPEYDSRQ